MNQISWVLVANSSTATVYQLDKHRKFVSVMKFEHPESRLHNRDLVTDGPGRAFESVGSTRHSLEPRHSPKHQEVVLFARDLTNFLETARNNQEMNQLYVAANPSLLGILRSGFGQELTKLIKGEVDKDLTQIPPEGLLEHFPFFP